MTIYTNLTIICGLELGIVVITNLETFCRSRTRSGMEIDVNTTKVIIRELSVPELKLRTPLLLPVPTDCPTLILAVLRDVITSTAAFDVFLTSISAAGVSEPTPILLSTTSAVTVADEPTMFPTVISGVPVSPNEVDANPAVCATPLRYPVNVDPVTLPVTPVTSPVTSPAISPTKLLLK